MTQNFNSWTANASQWNTESFADIKNISLHFAKLLQAHNDKIRSCANLLEAESEKIREKGRQPFIVAMRFKLSELIDYELIKQW